MPKRYPPEFRRKVLDLVAAGRRVAQVAADLDISEQTIYTWRHQELIDTGPPPRTGLRRPATPSSMGRSVCPHGTAPQPGLPTNYAVRAVRDAQRPARYPRPDPVRADLTRPASAVADFPLLLTTTVADELT
jgi:hypothetical protein